MYGFAKMSKNLTRFKNNLDRQNKYVGRSNWLLEYQDFSTLFIALEFI